MLKISTEKNLEELKTFAENELYQNIIPFWRTKMIDDEFGGFYGEISNDLRVNVAAPKGLILNARILWTFSAAYNLTKDEVDKQMADRAFDFICEYFYDKVFGGYYWSVSPSGDVCDSKKQIYALAFTLYGMSEYYKIFKNPFALKCSINLFHIIEEKSFDKLHNGYFEAFNADWSDKEDLRLSEKELNEKKTMNTHLHIVEAYANLFTIWKDSFLKNQIENLVELFLNKIIDQKDNHLNLFFDELWNSRSTVISYGHDIESGWLIHESACIHGDKRLIQKVENRLVAITDAALEGLGNLGGLYHENDRKGNHQDNEFEWWPQAEALVGLLNTYQCTTNEHYLNQAVHISKFIEDYMVDNEYGEWFYRVSSNGKPIVSYAKAGFWKCPYHSGRACIELIRRIGNCSEPTLQK